MKLKIENGVGPGWRFAGERPQPAAILENPAPLWPSARRPRGV